MDIGSSANGDIALSAGGVTQLSLVESIGQRVEHILRSKPGDWAREPNMGAYIAQYVGYPNIPSTKALIEEEVSDELNRDRIVGVFPSEVEYTPTSSDSGMLEITINLPDGNDITIHREISPAQGINPSEGLPYTPPRYNENEPVTRTELVTLTNEDNVFELTYLPINSLVFVSEYTDTLELDEDGYLDPISSGLTQTIELEEAYDLFVSGDAASGELPSGIITIRQYLLNSEMRDVVENKMIETVEVAIDGEAITTDDYIISTDKLVIREPYTEYVDGSLVRYGIEDDPSGTVTLSTTHYDYPPIVSIDSFEQDSAPNNVFPRHRLAEKNYVTMKQMFDPGTYFIQYLSYELEV